MEGVNLLTRCVPVSEEEMRVFDLLNSVSVGKFYAEKCKP
jgi:hypothetical protein